MANGIWIRAKEPEGSFALLHALMANQPRLRSEGKAGSIPLSPASFYPFTLPDVSPCTKKRWQVTNTITTGISVSTDMANT